ncbi:Homocysteine S-methyltransferase [Enhygromyxa salina]|uniref:Homocysteine S-methyltransferase n=1 Tax=Enhygromyxa salina TaxID=215803 RepID=A0A2S9YCP8_9BACT|nr:homocysteine S-methyltransferase [Enhygromyxa salina]PRQ02879.1 Homocysteine S-methyltransferase [Enhygromyxa salina]
MADRLDELLARERFAILDGGLATELERAGCELDDPLWSARVLLDEPARLTRVHRRFVEAGAEILATASYQATIPGLVARGLDEREARAALRQTVSLARAAAEPATLVAASIGSYGAYLADGSEYRGDYGLDRQALVEFHRPRLRELSAAGPDLLAFETIPDAVEAEAIAELLAREPGPRAWVSFSLRPDASLRISDGTPLARAVRPLLGHPRVAALGVNCLGPREVLAAVEALASLAPLTAIVAYPNSGERWVHPRPGGPGCWAGAGTELEEFQTLAGRWAAAGARLIGGCCRTRPRHIAALVELRAQLDAQP